MTLGAIVMLEAKHIVRFELSKIGLHLEHRQKPKKKINKVMIINWLFYSE